MPVTGFAVGKHSNKEIWIITVTITVAAVITVIVVTVVLVFVLDILLQKENQPHTT